MTTRAPVYTTAGATSFWRTYQVTIETGDGTAAQWGNVDAGSSNLRMAFSVTRKGTGGDPSAGGTAPGPRTLVLTNLSPRSRNLLARGSRVTLKTGYGPVLDTMFIGTIMRVVTERSGADINSNIELLDGEAFSQGCFFKASYAPGENLSGGVKLTTILQDIAGAMQLTYYNNTVSVQAGIALGIKEIRYPTGKVFNGSCAQALNDLLSPQGLQWNVYNGALNVIPLKGYDGQTAFFLSPQSGLINTPAFLEGKFAVDGRHRLTFQTLLNPQLQPGRLVTFQLPGQQILSDTTLGNLTGYYKVIDATHKGDTHGQAWDTSCEAEIYEGQIGAVPVAAGFNYATAVVP